MRNKRIKEQAVKLTYTSHKSVQQIADDLGVATNMLHRWRREQRAAGDGVVAFPGAGHAQDEELLNLRKAPKQAEMERDTLRVKKAVAFFAQPPRRICIYFCAQRFGPLRVWTCARSPT